MDQSPPGKASSFLSRATHARGPDSLALGSEVKVFDFDFLSLSRALFFFPGICKAH